MLSILFGLLSGVIWGAGDFTGGLASRRTGVYRVVLYGEAAGLILLLAAVGLIGEAIPAFSTLLWCASAGMLGSIGLLILYHSMSIGQMSIAAPVSALFAAILPILVGSATEGLPGIWQFAGFGLALAAIWLISKEDGNTKKLLTHIADLRLPLLAGLCFGLYFILINQGSQEAVLWPMVISRSAGMTMVLVFMLLRKETWRVGISVWPLIILNGFLDVGGNAFYILAGQAGRMDIAAVLSSLYPGTTVILAWIVLKERLTHSQKLGILIALAAIVIMTL